jgi:peptide/nickel transport system substrate-binding protein
VAQRTDGRSTLWKVLAMLMAFGLIAAACGDAEDGAAPTPPPDDTVDDGEEEDTATATTRAPEVVDDGDGEPVHGGRLVYGMEADSANPWAHYRTSCAISCYVVLQTISDPLFFANPEGEVIPYLVESFEPNDDYTAWTFDIREGITFHDGSPLDAEAVKFNIETCVGSSLTGPAYSNIGPMEADGQTLTITTATTPWVALPTYFAGGQCSYMFSEEWLQTLADVPHRDEDSPFYDAELAGTPADGIPDQPVGLGAWQYVSYTPGNGNSFVAERNEDYWRGENGITGEELPYLDEVELVVAVDIDSRTNGLRSGQFDIIHTANADEINNFEQDGGFEVNSSNVFGETSHILLNVAQGTNAMTGAEIDPEGANAENPLNTLACRRALAHGIDNERLAEERGAGIVEPANGPFPPGSIGHLDDTGYPQYDPEAAQAELDTCLEERGTDSIEFAFNTTNDPFNVESNQLIISMWQEIFGDQVRATITPIEQGQYIGLALTGNFQALGWRNHGGIDPDQQLLWWISATASPIGALALNFGRFSDPVIDENLLTIRMNPDPDARREAAENVNRRFGEQVYHWWNTWTLWAAVNNEPVNNVTSLETPEGESVIPIISGRHPLPQIWCTGGQCS